MSVALIVGGNTYNYPALNDELWSQAATNWAIAVTSELAQVAVVGDIGPTTVVNIANNQSSPINVTNLMLSSATIRAGFVEYYVYRTWNGGTQEVLETGELFLAYSDIAATWTVAQVGNGVGSTGTVFSITNAGQVQYTSSNLTPNNSYTGTMKYRLRVLQKS